MSDLRQDLGRLADEVGEPVSFRELQGARRRRDRRRRSAGLIVGVAAGLSVLIVAGLALGAQLRSNPTPSLSPAGPEPHWRTVSDPAGWTMSFPPGWIIRAIDRPSEVGHAVVSTDAGSLAGLVVDVSFDPRATRTVTDDSPFPLDAASILSPTAEGPTESFRADGRAFSIVVTFPGATLSPDAQEVVRRIVSSIVFQPWSAGEIRHGLLSVGSVDDQYPNEPRVVGLPLTIGGDLLVVPVPGDTGAFTDVELSPNPCGRLGLHLGVEVLHGPDRVELSCDGAVFGTFGFDGTPFPGNRTPWDRPFESHGSLRAWDGSILFPIPRYP